MSLYSGVPDCPSREPGLPSQRLVEISNACAGISGTCKRMHTALEGRKRLSASELAELRAFVGGLADSLASLKATVNTDDEKLLNVRGEW